MKDKGFSSASSRHEDLSEIDGVVGATPFHHQDPFDSTIQRVRDETEQKIYGLSGGVSTDDAIWPLFHDGFERPANSAQAHDVLKTDRWGLKGTMVALADRLGTDHGTISRWYHQGILPGWLRSYLMAYRNKPLDWQAPIDKVFNARHRAGFLFIARYLYGKMPGRSAYDGERLSEIHAEFLFEILNHRKKWEAARVQKDLAIAETVGRAVCDEGDRGILPFWYTKKQRAKTVRLIAALRGNSRLAFRYLCLLQRHWESIFVLTWAAMEGMGWIDDWEGMSEASD